jgi:hypothetical protein
LPSIHIIVAINTAFGFPALTEQLRCPICEYFIHVHIGLRSRSGLPDNQGKFRVMAAGNYFVGCLDNGCRLIMIEQAKIAVYAGGGALEHGKSMN